MSDAEDREVIKGWKAIGDYFGWTGDRHAQRVEKEKGLPVHRRGVPIRVFAYRDELDEWQRLRELATTSPKSSEQPPPTTIPEEVPPRVRIRLALLGLIIVSVVALLILLLPTIAEPHPVSRGEFVIRLVEALKESGSGPDGKRVTWPTNCSITMFQDVDDQHPLAQDCRFAYAMSQRILEGNREGETLDPDLPIKRIEAARLLVLGAPELRRYYDSNLRRFEDRCRKERVCKSIDAITGREEFLDVPTFQSYPDGGWYYYHVYAVTALGVISPRTSFRFDIEGEVMAEEVDQWLCVAIPATCSSKLASN